MPQITTDEVKHMVYDGLDKVVSVSRAGLQYAIEQHKVCIIVFITLIHYVDVSFQTVHVSVNMRSPYVVIPEHGTLHMYVIWRLFFFTQLSILFQRWQRFGSRLW
jgi:hypothetical protein